MKPHEDLNRLLSSSARRALGMAGHGSWRGRARPDAVPLNWGLPFPDALPVAGLIEATRRVLERHGTTLLQYGGGEAAARFAHAVEARLTQRGFKRDGRRLLITSGSTQGLDWICRAFVDPGDGVGVEAPTYMGAIRLFQQYGAALRGFPVDEGGLVVEALEDALRSGWRPKLLYLIPNFHNPTGVTLEPARRRRLIDLAARCGFLIIEDDAYGELYFGQEPPGTMQALDDAGVVLHAGTVSKIVAPGVRLGWLDVPETLAAPLEQVRSDGGPNPFAQGVVAELMEHGDLEAHLAFLRQAYRRRAAQMDQLLRAHLPAGVTWTRPQGGFFIWCRLPAGIDADAVAAAAVDEGVVCLPGRWFYPGPPAENGLRLSFSYTDPETMARGVAALGRAAGRVMGRTAEAR